jgi:competence protein ComFC
MKILKNLIQIIYPNRCISCQNNISYDAKFCVNCWQSLEFIKQPFCQICSFPFELEIIDNQKICANCLSKKQYFDKTITVFRYNEVIGKALGNFKYRDQTYLAKIFAKELLKIAGSEIDDCDIICGVPIHFQKLRNRKFNQAILMAKHLNSNKINYNLIFKINNKKSQVRLTQKQRLKNLKKSFLINPKFAKKLQNKNIILIDDVITTATTINAVAKVLKQNGAKKVVVLAIAKTIFS